MESIPKKIQRFLTKALSLQNPSKDQVGQVGEEAIACYVKQLGWKILARNWRPEGAYHGLELDIIAQKKDTLIFIEVKTRTIAQRRHEKNHRKNAITAQNTHKNKQDFSSHETDTSPLHTLRHKENEDIEQEQIPAYASFTKKKQQNIIQAAKHYLASEALWESPCQFDLFCVQEDSNGTFGIEHYEHVIEIGQTVDSRYSHWEP